MATFVLARRQFLRPTDVKDILAYATMITVSILDR